MEYFIKYLKIAVIGYGSIGKRHIQNLLNIKNIEIIICTKQNIKNPNIKKIKIVKSILECIEQKPDIGIITNETSKHVKVANQLVKQDVDVFIEKPLSNSTKDLKILKKTIENCYFGLKKNGYMLINIANTPKYKFIEKETVNISKDIGFTQEPTVDLILSSVAGKGVKTEPIFVFKKESQ